MVQYQGIPRPGDRGMPRGKALGMCYNIAVCFAMCSSKEL